MQVSLCKTKQTKQQNNKKLYLMLSVFRIIKVLSLFGTFIFNILSLRLYVPNPA